MSERDKGVSFAPFVLTLFQADGEPGFGMQAYVEGHHAFLNWGQTVELHKWLTELLAEHRA
jgi:hypothetical protein